MSLADIKRFLCFALALVFCIGVSVYPNETAVSAKTETYNEPNVRVGMYVDAPLLDTRVFSSNNKSSDGFDIGYSSSDSFVKLFSISNSSVILLPQVNARYSSGACSQSGEANIGSYSVIAEKHSSYSSAKTASHKYVDGFVAVVNGGYEVRFAASTSYEAAKKASLGKSVASPVNGGITVIDANSGKIVFTFEDTSKKMALQSHNGGSLNLPMRHRSGSVNYYDYSGFFEYSASGSLLQMVNILGLEDYTKCVMANEIGTNFSVETRKAFSVLARTVPLNSKHKKQGFDVCSNSACCQVYHGLYRMSEENNKIVDSTRGLFCAYKGQPIAVLYHNSNGGASCSSVAAWGGAEVPYLTTVFQPEADSGDKWQRVYSKQEFFEYITSRKTFSSLEDSEISVEILATDPYGSDYITLLSVSDGSGNVIRVETSEDVRSACGFTSANFDIEYSAEAEVLTADGTVKKQTVSGVMTADGYKEFSGFGDSYKTPQGVAVSPETITIDGAGVGHGVGFSATGSEQLSSEGYSYKYILTFFFNGTTLETVSK